MNLPQPGDGFLLILKGGVVFGAVLNYRLDVDSTLVRFHPGGECMHLPGGLVTLGIAALEEHGKES